MKRYLAIDYGKFSTSILRRAITQRRVQTRRVRFCRRKRRKCETAGETNRILWKNLNIWNSSTAILVSTKNTLGSTRWRKCCRKKGEDKACTGNHGPSRPWKWTKEKIQDGERWKSRGCGKNTRRTCCRRCKKLYKSWTRSATAERNWRAKKSANWSCFQNRSQKSKVGLKMAIPKVLA